MGSMIAAMGILFWFSVQDFRKRSFAVQELLIAALLGGIAAVVFRTGLGSAAAGISVGVVLYIAACCSREQIGKGDAILLMITGVILGGQGNLELLLLALLLAAVYAGWLLVVKRAGRRSRFAFVPFLGVAQLFRLVVHLTMG